ncbi:MAG: hypothetical protein EOM59_05025 [Clostridia bacterium]|nr:hypothetical protein [Clostridia bacterium]
MMKQYEEPLFIDVKQNSPQGEDAKTLADVIRKLSEDQPFAVLATPINSGKFDLIAGDENVAILVDDRSNQQDSINQISALTITGKARIISDESEIAEWALLLTKKHPYLTAFVKAPTTALVLVEVVRFLYVSKFQEVWGYDA